MKNPTVVAIALLVLGTFFFVGCWGSGDGVSEPVLLYRSVGSETTVQFVNNPVPVNNVTVEDLDGNTISSHDWHGKVTFVNFWATWCRPCLEEIPDLVKLQERYGDYLQIIGVSTDDGPVERVKEFVQEHGINYPVVMNTPELQDAFPGVFALPTSFILDLELQTVQKHVGLVNPYVFEQEIRVLAGLQTDVTVVRVEDTGQVLLSNAAQATEIPDLDLSELTAEQKVAVLHRLNEDSCPCECQMTVAQCRINDASCQFSLPKAQAVLEDVLRSEL